MSFLKKLFGLPDENDFDAMYEVKCNYDPEKEQTPTEEPVRYVKAPEGNFMFTVGDIFVVKNRGVVVTGVIESGTISVGDEVTLNGAKEQAKFTVAGIECFRKLLESASMGDNVGLLLSGASKEQIARGDKLYR